MLAKRKLVTVTSLSILISKEKDFTNVSKVVDLIKEKAFFISSSSKEISISTS